MKFGRDDYNKRIIDTENKIPVDEPVFLLRAQDKFAPELLLRWAMKVRLEGGDPNVAAEAEGHAQKMLDWQKIHGSKTPDMYRDSKEKQFIADKLKDILYNSSKLNINELTTWLGKYYDTSDPNNLMVLMPVDLKDEARGKVVDDLSYEDFDIDDDQNLRAFKAKVIVYFNGSTHKVLKDKIQYGS
jgi:hypothetical protein